MLKAVNFKSFAVGLLLLQALVIKAQNTSSITIQQAIQMALAQNGQIKSKQLAEKWAQTFVATATDLGKTQLNTEIGQVNTSNTDTKFSIVQNFALPTVYKQQKQVLQTAVLQAQSQTRLQKADLVKMVKQVCFQLQYIYAIKQVLLKTDSIYTKFAAIATLRYIKGETSLLEKTTLANQQIQLQFQLQQLQADEQVQQQQLQWLLNSTLKYTIAGELSFDMHAVADTTSLQQHPYLQWWGQQWQQAQQQTQLEKARLLPEITVGYTNQSFVGWQMAKNRTEQYYTLSNRFSVAQAGVTLPIFNKAQKARIAAAKTNELLMATNKEIAGAEFKMRLQKWQTTLHKHQLAQLYFTKTALPQSQLLTQQATQQYQAGQIGYLEWGTAITTAFNTQSQYADHLLQLNIAQSEIDYLLTPDNH